MNHPRHSPFLNKTLALTGLALLPIFAWFLWTWNQGETISQSLQSFGKLGDSIKESVSALPTIAPVKADTGYTIEDEGQNAIKITYPSAAKASEGQVANEDESQSSFAKASEGQALKLSFPQDIGSQPLAVNLPNDKTFSITSQSPGKDYTSSIISADSFNNLDVKRPNGEKSLMERFFPKKAEAKYVKYESDDGRKIIYYAYQSDGSTGAKTLKHWTIYRRGDGNEKETYAFDKALLKKNDDGTVSVYYTDPDALKNQEGAAGVDSNLLERAQRVLAADAAENLDNREADALIPAPFVLDKDGNKHDLTWVVSDDKKSLSVTINFTTSLASDGGQPSSLYPLALDPTLSFTAPAISNTGDTITGEIAGGNFSYYAVGTGDWNSDGRPDLAVGARYYSTSTGRAYIFYNDGSFSATAAGADVIITGEGTNEFFGSAFAGADFNADGRTDLVIGRGANSGRVYIFYNDGNSFGTAACIQNCLAANADIIISGSADNNNYFGQGLTIGDWNTDGKMDLAVSAARYSTGAATGRAYIFYNDGSIPTAADSADIIITGEATSNSFGGSVAGDFNSDGRTDIAVGASGYSSNTGRVYIFYNDGSFGTSACTTACLASNADIMITGQTTGNYFGSPAVGDFNSDGKTDLIVGANQWSGGSDSGRVYIFYNDGTSWGTSACTTNCLAANADNFINQEGGGRQFGTLFSVGDFNADGRTDFAAQDSRWPSNNGYGRVYIFYNDGSYPTVASSADVIITGETSNNDFGNYIIADDFNSDGKTDLVVGAYQYASSRGKVYIFYSQNGQVNTNQSITGGASGDKFGQAMTTGDVNADGRTDLIVGAREYNPGGAANTGRVYIFYGDGQIPSTANSADVVIVGAATGNYFGSAMTTGDFNADGKTDLAVGANGTYSSIGGRVYIFYNDGSISTTAANADVIFTDEGTSNFGWVLAAGDYNADGKTDIVISAMSTAGNNGRAYVFYDDGTNNFGTATCAGTPAICLAANADAIITSNSGACFLGSSFASADFNADGKVDLAIGGYGCSGNTGNVFIFYGGSISTKWEYEANVTITGETSNNYFGIRLTSGDFNADGKVDLAVGAYGYSSNTGRTYIFYNDGSIPTTGATADVIITGEASSNFGISLSAGDFNADGRTDLAVGGDGIATNTGKSYIFYNDGSIPTTAATADIIITGETTSNYFGNALTAGDMNGDGRVDLIVGAYGNATNTGKVYFYQTRENFAWQLQKVSTASGGLRVNPNITGQELSITGETGSYFGESMVSGDFNADGKIDLAVGAHGRERIYIFYNDGSVATSATSADVVIGNASGTDHFGTSLSAGDLNSDGRTDLVVSATGYDAHVYIFYNDGAYPRSADRADISIDGENTYDLGNALTTGDFNSDGKTDLAVAESAYPNSNIGRVYIFYNDGSYPTTAATADVIISGVSGYFGFKITSGDLNADGKTDIVVGTSGAATVYIFYADGTNNFGTATCSGTPAACSAANADVIITGTGYFAWSLAAGDFNADGRVDLAVGKSGAAAYIFYNDGSMPTTEGAADVTITGGSGYYGFGLSLLASDMNADGRTDLVVGYPEDNSSTGRAYIFYNDGSIPTTAATADVILSGEVASSYFGFTLVALDMNSDGKNDLVVGAYPYSSNRGKVYIYTMNDVKMNGEASGNNFGIALVAGDFNNDSKIDLAVGANGGGAAGQGRVYVFYNDGIYPTGAASADVIITGSANNDQFGFSLAAADMNSDGKMDLIAGAPRYSGVAGGAFIFYNANIITQVATSANVIITGESSFTYFGTTLTMGDFDANGKTDLAVGAWGGGALRAYIFNNDGSIPTTAASADVTITGDASSDFSFAMTAGDFNFDGRTDLAVGARNYSSATGRAYIFYNDGSIPTITANADVTITGEGGKFGDALTAGDFNADGRVDLAVGAQEYNSSYGRVYLFYNDGSIPTTAATADVTIAGLSGNYFGNAFTIGHWNADGRTDLAVGAVGANKAYVFYNDGAYPPTASSAEVTHAGVADGVTNAFGAALMAGDFNADGKQDLAIGGTGYYASPIGNVYLIMSEAAVETTPNVTKVRGTVKMKGTIKVR